jgi:hypothetical protein
MRTSPRKKLPIGIQNLREIREGGYYYVDKTAFACQLYSTGKYYFLSRPRRFGKSLFVDTLKELFEGNRELFTGLHAEHHWNWSKTHPVIRISFSDGILKSRGELARRIGDQLAQARESLGLDTPLDAEDNATSFARLVRAAHSAHGRTAVVLVDEYDKPILDNIGAPEVAAQMREGLKDLYSVLKGADPHLRFVFVTGVSKFSKVSLFSGLNNLVDITLDPQTSALCGYTESDLDEVFAPELPGLDREEIRRWYNGYNWTGEAVYNPFDLLLFFRFREFKPWWYETGNPSFLLELLRERNTFLPDLSRLVTGEALLSTFDVEHIAVEALLFQAGYLTIHGHERQANKSFYQLGYPNLEVFQSLNDALLLDWTPPETRGYQPKLYPLLRQRDAEGVGRVLRAFFASIPHQWVSNNPIARYEGYYASVFYAFFASLGLDIRVEESSSEGRLDMAVIHEGLCWVFEFKVVDGEAEGTALAQIRERGYDRPHREAGLEVICVGVEFSKAKRQIVAWDIG